MSASSKTPTQASQAKMSAVALFGVFIIWYALSGSYNVYNSLMKKGFEFPYAIACLQLIVGMVYALPLWFLGLRKVPSLSLSDFSVVLPICLLNAIGHFAAVYAMFQPGGGSFTHVIKASEPVVSGIFGFLILHAVPKPLTAISLVVVTYGVAYASTLGNLNAATMSKELTTTAAT